MPMIPANQAAARAFDKKVRQERAERAKVDPSGDAERAEARRVRSNQLHREARKKQKPSAKPKRVARPSASLEPHVRWPGREAGAPIPRSESHRRSASQREAQNRPEVKAKTAAKAKASWQNPDVRARRIAAQTAAENRPEKRAKTSTAMRAFWANADHATRERRSAATKAGIAKAKAARS